MITAPLLLITVIYLTVFFVPGRRELRRLRADLDATIENSYQAESKGTRIEAIRADLNATKEYTEQWRNRALGSPKYAELYGRVLTMGRETGTVFRSFDPDTPVPMNYLDQMPVQLVCAGNFTSIFDFIRRLEAFPETILVNSVDMVAPSQDGGLTECSLELVIFTDHSQNSN